MSIIKSAILVVGTWSSIGLRIGGGVAGMSGKDECVHVS